MRLLRYWWFSVDVLGAVQPGRARTSDARRVVHTYGCNE